MNNSFTRLLSLIYPFLVVIFEGLEGKASKEQVEALAIMLRDKLKEIKTDKRLNMVLYGLIYDALDDYFILLAETRGQATTERERARKQEQRKRKDYYNYFITVYILLNTINGRMVHEHFKCIYKATKAAVDIKGLKPDYDNIDYMGLSGLYIEQVKQELLLLRVFIFNYILNEDIDSINDIRQRLRVLASEVERAEEEELKLYRYYDLVEKEREKEEQEEKVKRLKIDYIKEVEASMVDVVGKFEGIILPEQRMHKIVESFNAFLEEEYILEGKIDEDTIYTSINKILGWL